MQIEWTFYTSTSAEHIKMLEDEYGVVFPETYKKIVLEFNEGYPNPNCFDLGREKGKVFESLLSINKEDDINIFDFSEDVSPYEGNKLIAFGSDPFGNYLCFDYSETNVAPTIVFYDHEKAYEVESYKAEFVSKNFDDFLSMLYDYDED